MEQKEQTQESTEVTGSVRALATEVASDTDGAKKNEITKQIVGREFELEASLAEDDKTIKTVTIVKKAQHKGCNDPLIKTQLRPLKHALGFKRRTTPALSVTKHVDAEYDKAFEFANKNGIMVPIK